MMGEPFAKAFLSHLHAVGVPASSCGVIASNPDRSKHLETATMVLHGLELDFVNLRAESYAIDSRIPHKIVHFLSSLIRHFLFDILQEFGTPLEDARRRDITINAMFYNIHTEMVEDFTGMGIVDLKNGVIRTPLAPRETLMDDPLRLIRVVRFASRFQYTIADDLYEAMHSTGANRAFRDKVSRERVGMEMEKIFSGKFSLSGFHLLVHVGLYDAVFTIPHVVIGESRPKVNLEEVVKLVESLLGGSHCDLFAMLAIALIPYWQCKYEIKAGKIEPVVAFVIRDSLKLSNRHVNEVLNLTQSYDEILAVFGGMKEPTRMGRLVSSIGSKWQSAFELALLRAFFYQEVQLRSDTFKDVLQGAIQSVKDLGLEDAWNFKPLLSGDELIDLFNISKGPEIRRLHNALMDWQYEHPKSDKTSAIDFIRNLLGNNSNTENVS